MDSYSYRTLYRYLAEGEFPEDELSVEVLGAHRGRLPETPEPPFLLASRLNARSQVSVTDLRTGVRVESIVTEEGFWVREPDTPGWIEFSSARRDDLLILADVFSPQTALLPDGGTLFPYIYTEAPLMAKSETIEGRVVTHRCWIAPKSEDGIAGAIAHPGIFTLLSEAEVHLWTAEEDTRLVRLALNGSHTAECPADCDFVNSHDVPRELLLWMELFEVGRPIEIEPPDKDQIALNIPPVDLEPSGTVAAPLDELPLPDDAIAPGSSETFAEDPREYGRAAYFFFQNAMDENAGPSWYHTPAIRWSTYLTGKGLSETSAFYLKEMDHRGWKLKGRFLRQDIPTLYLFFEQENVVLPIFLSLGEAGGTYITAMLPPNAEVLEAVEKGWTWYTPQNSDLSDEWVYALAFDQKGRTWMGTRDGVDIFDDGEWTHYTIESMGLGEHDYVDVKALAVDTTGRVWVGTDAGLTVFDGQSWKPTDIGGGARRLIPDVQGGMWIVWPDGLSLLHGEALTHYDEEDIGFSAAHSITDLVVDDRQQVWVSTDGGGLYVFDGKAWQAVQKTTNPPNVVGGGFNDLVIDEQGWLWVSGAEGLQVFDGAAWMSYTIESGLPYYAFEGIAVDSYNRLWAASSQGGLSAFRTEGQWVTYTPISAPDYFSINAVEVDPQGRVWLALLDGVMMFDPPEPASTTVRVFPTPTSAAPTPTPAPMPESGWTRYTAKNSGLVNDVVNTLAVDSQGRVWIGTSEGLSVFGLDGSLTSYTIANSGLIDQSIYALAVDDQDRVWIGTNYGLAQLDPDGNWTIFPPDEGVFYPVEEIPEGAHLMFPVVNALALDNQGRVWMGVNCSGTCYAVTVLDTRSKWTTYIPENSGLPDAYVAALTVDEEGQVWIGTWEGVSVLRAEGHWENLTPDELGLTGEYVSITALAFDEAGRLWIGSTVGLAVRDRDGSLTRYTASDSELINDFVQALAIDGEGRVWVGTLAGLNVLAPDGTWTSYPNGNSRLPLGGITALAIDQQGRVWMGTPWGVSVLAP
jgi:ligand-binding sensor domain-containing protein